jgi:DtxR family Mn-dependent transcriptional regulator
MKGMDRPNTEGCPRTIQCLREDGIGPVAPSAIATGRGDPTVDPHGASIPNAEPGSTEVDAASLTEHDEGDTVIERVVDRDPTELDCLAETNIAPSTQVTITDVVPFGAVTIESRNEEPPIALSATVTDDIRVSATGRQTTPTSGIGEGV